jgi:hypothetical protein
MGIDECGVGVYEIQVGMLRHHYHDIINGTGPVSWLERKGQMSNTAKPGIVLVTPTCWALRWLGRWGAKQASI